MPDKTVCQLCGEEWEGEIPEQEMFLHLLFNHPMDVLESRKVQTTIGNFMFRLGERLADRLKGA